MTQPLCGDALRQRVEKRLDASPELLDTPVSTCVVVPDATRPLAYGPVVRPLVERLIRGGSPVEVVVGVGLHRPMTPRELKPLQQVVQPFDVDIFQHDAGAEELVDFGAADQLPPSAPDEIPIALNRRVVDAGRIVCVGTVEPHQYAGFSGGIKAASIGCGGEQTITAMHGPSFLRDERTALGRVDDNPFQQSLWRIAKPLEGVVGLQVVPAAGGGVRRVVFDEIDAAFRRACRSAGELFFENVDRAPVDWLYLVVPEVKASNFYQASRAATYAALVDRPAIREGGTILVEASCPEGVGTGRGERAFGDAMMRGGRELLADLKERANRATRGGQQRAWVLAQTCRRHRVALVGAARIPELEPMGIDQFTDIDEAFDELDLEAEEGLRIDDVFHRIPQAPPS